MDGAALWEFGALHHWDLPFGSTTYRVFLLSGGLVDLAFTPAAELGPRGPAWRTVFGATVRPVPSAPPRRDDLVGLGWHHVLHARTCIERGKPWQAEHWISALRDQVLALACLRLGHPGYAKGADLLPPELRASLVPALVRSLEEAELRRALPPPLPGWRPRSSGPMPGWRPGSGRSSASSARWSRELGGFRLVLRGAPV